jgi:trehalose synthase-fused probable maltokinase
MSDVPLERVPDYFKVQRWFGRKAWPIRAVRVMESVRLPASGGQEAVIGVVEVTYVGVPAEHYLLAVIPDGRGGLADALQDDEVVRGLFRLIRDAATVSTGGTTLRGDRLAGAAKVLEAISAFPAIRRLQVEQTNTSVVLEDRVIFKVIRKLEPGLNPEYEVGKLLSERTAFRGAPALLGAVWLEGLTQMTLATLHHYTAGSSDGWSHVLRGFRQAPGALPAALLDEIRDLGRQVGELHLALASVPDEPAFAPEPIQLEDLQRWSATLVGEIGVTLAEASRQFPDLFDRRAEVVQRARRLAHLQPSGKKMRIHGDLHLGQVLRVEGGWLVFDFEGEPGRSFQQRREKHSPLRDVAGMLRSFAYAAAAVELEGAPRTDRVEKARAAFLDGYLSVVQSSGLLPERDVDCLGLLHGLELEKVVYEIRYEVNHRPDWAKIPIAALLNPGEPGGA